LPKNSGERLDPDEINEVIHDCGNLEEGFLSYARNTFVNLYISFTNNAVGEIISFTSCLAFLKNLLNGPDLESHSFEQTPSDLPNQEKPIPVLNMSNAKPMESDSCSSPSAAFTLKAPKQRSQSVVEDPNPKSAAATAAFTLKTPAKSKTEEDKKASKAAAAAAVAAELKPKNQQPLISMKMMAMIGNIK
jgi:type IV secretory pathway VirB10-like protein